MSKNFPKWYEIYQEKVMEWHEIVQLTPRAEMVHNYLTNPQLIQSEIQECFEAANDSNPVELLDGILDILWEAIPCLNYCNDFVKVVELDCAGEEEPTMKEAFIALAAAFESSIGHKLAALATFERTAVAYLSGLADDLQLQALSHSIVASNFSKLFDLSVYDIKAIEEDLQATQAKYPDRNIYYIVSETNPNFLFFEQALKLQKPAIKYVEPDLKARMEVGLTEALISLCAELETI